MAIQSLSRAQVQKHSTADSVWVIFKNKVYDVTEFMEDHPGGKDFLLEFAGKDITETMGSHPEHSHSAAAYDILDPFCVGVLEEKDQEDHMVNHQVIHSADFIDLEKPMVYQLWKSKFSKAFYLQQVNIPRHTKSIPRFFANPILEWMCQTPIWIVPTVWIPLIGFFSKTACSEMSVPSFANVFLLGLANWPLLEYFLHRCVFHMNRLLPDTPGFLCLHFLLHGVHHYLPMDKYKIIMPLPLFMAHVAILYGGLSAVLPWPVKRALMAGLFSGYLIYDMTHYYIHHGRPSWEYVKMMKKHHMEHHYKQWTRAFGIVTKTWDYVFASELK